MKDPVVLKVYRGDRLISVKQFLSPQVVIGRQTDAGLNLDDESVAPLHAVIELRQDGYYLSDMGSSTGVSIEGAKVLESKLESGESVGIGPYSIRFYIGIPTPPVEPNYKVKHVPPVVVKDDVVEAVTPESKVEESAAVTPTKEVAPTKEEDPHLAFSDNENEKTDPLGIAEDGGSIKIATPGVEETLSRQKYEPISGGYTAPLSSHSSVEEVINLHSRGSVLEVILSWKERVLETYHFSDSKDIYISNSEDGDLLIPLAGANFKHKFISFNNECVIHLANSMSGTLYENDTETDLSSLPNNSNLKLEQGQTAKVDFLNGQVSLFMRYVEDAPAATRAPVFDFTSSELIGIFMSVASVLIVALYMLFYVPDELGDTDKLLEDRLKKAVITFTPPPRVKVEIPKAVEKIPEPKVKITRVTEEKAKPKTQKQQLKAGDPKTGDGSKKSGKPKAAAPSRVKSKNKVGSSRPGGSVKTGKKAANQESKKKDLTKTGILGVLSGGGANTALDKAYSGTGTTIGTADSKTGFQGQLSDQKGEGLGSKLQAGKGGAGSALAGVGDIKTSGRGGGQAGYGTSGLGGKGKTTILNVEGTGAGFSSTIDKDAIRRLIRRNVKAFQGCYERALSQNASLRGTVKLSWKIIDSGRMIEPKVVSSTLKNSEVENCVIRRLMGLTFPKPGTNEIAEVESYPFKFEATK